MKRVVVNGAGGFIGSHLVRALKKEGMWVRGVDLRNALNSAIQPQTNSCKVI